MSWSTLLPLLAQAEQATETSGTWSGWMIVIAMLALIIVPFMLGGLMAKWLKMYDSGWKFGVVLFALCTGALIVTAGEPKLGIDLGGGLRLIYQVDPEALREREADPEAQWQMEDIVGSLMERINPAGVKDIIVRPYGEGQVEIIVPQATPEEAAQIKNVITRIGALAFRIVADERVADHQAAIEAAKKTNSRDVYLPGREKPVARWMPMEAVLSDDGENIVGGYAAEIAGQEDFQNYVVRGYEEARPEVLLMMPESDAYDVTGRFLARAQEGFDQAGNPAVRFTFSSEGAKRFGALTSANLQRKLAIVLDNQVRSAPVIQSTITDSGEITGNFTQQEVKELVAVLNAGALPAALDTTPTFESNMGPRLGEDTIKQGKFSIIGGLSIVLVFMLIYYRFAGLVACLAVLFNLLLIVGLMILFNASFTLPGLAGLVLTVGMSVDANVLIFERIREELSRGAALRMAIRNGFARATTTIVDANLTTLITAIVLYVIGTEEVKGFAVVLFLGIALSMFTAIFCARLVFDVAERLRILTKLTMMRIVGETNINWVGKAVPAICVSIILIVIGLVSVIGRGRDLLDIDFTGGSSIMLEFNTPHDDAEVRQKATAVLDQVTISNVPESAGKQYIINTAEADLDHVAELMEQAFPGDLIHNNAEIIEVTDATAAASPSDAPAAGPEERPAADTDDAEKTSLLVPPAGELLALAVGQPADEPAEDAPKVDAPKEDAPKEDAPKVDEPADDAPKSDEPAEAAPKADEPAAETPTPAAEPAEDAPAAVETTDEPVAAPAAEDAADGDAADSEAPAAAAAGNERSRVKLRFQQPVTEQDLATTVENVLARSESLPAAIDRGVRFTVTSPNPDYIRGSEQPLLDWYVTADLSQDQMRILAEAVVAEIAATPYFPSRSMIGAPVAADAREAAIAAVLASLVFIVGYIWIRFQRVVFGLAAVVALVHDVLITLGALAISAYVAPALGFLLVDPFKINLAIIAAFLTIIGYSLNDTIVIFDRVREVRGKSPVLTQDMINTSVNQTLSRTILTSLTTLLVVVVLYFFGGQGIHGFAFALVIGVVAGTYSTVFIACPTLLWMSKPARATATSGASSMRSATGASS